MPSNPTSGHDRSADVHAAIKMGIAAMERRDYESAFKVLSAVYEKRAIGTPLEGLSYYGLLLAMIEKKNKLGIDCCRAAISSQFYDSAHYINLIKIYNLAKSRRLAIEVLEEGMSRMPKDESLLKMRDQMRYRSRPVVSFFHRDHVVNQYLGRIRGRQPQLYLGMQVGVMVIVLIVMFVLTFAWLRQQSL